MERGAQRAKKIEYKKKSVAEGKAPQEPLFVVGIGASAGGLEALRALVSRLNQLNDACLIVVQHLSPQHRSMLVDLISRETSIRVKEAENGEKPKANSIYITPPNANITFEDGKMVLTTPTSKVGPKPSVDLFLESLAEELGEQSVGIILSGTGTDGARGMRAIKAADGLTMVQDPETAKYDGMPRAAIESTTIDIIAKPEDMATEINRISQFDLKGRIPEEIINGDPFKTILSKLKLETGVDLSLYKSNMIRRRLHRRMMATHTDSSEEYLKLIEKNPKELHNFFQDVLISVTSFFRDTSAYSELSQQISRYFKFGYHPDNSFRVWVPGCATGEEAYSIAMLVAENLPENKSNLKVQIFATDISEPALAVGRKGLYPEAAVTRLPAPLRQKYLVALKDSYQVKKNIRDMVVFARQNILRDPPFLKVDLISCRNLFIYFNQETQDRILEVFHYALNPKGILFLGKSESLGKSEKHFKVLQQGARLYSRTSEPISKKTMRNIEISGLSLERPKIKDLATKTDIVPVAISRLGISGAIVDESMYFKKVFGAMSDLMRIPEGDASQAFLKYIHPELRNEVSTLVYRCRKEKARILGRLRQVEVNGKLRNIQLSVLPVREPDATDYLVEVLQNTPAKEIRTTKTKKLHTQPDERVKELEQELTSTREHLQTVVEELETSNEELQALNEELQSANEELQSANEELETSNEELHATNEELTTLNEEINVKSAEVATLNDYLESVQNALQFPLFVVDKNLHLVRHNPACETLFKSPDSLLGTNLRLVPSAINLNDAFDLIEESLKTLKTQQKRMHLGGRIYEEFVQPLKNAKEELQGAVVLFFDISDRENALKTSMDAEKMLQSILRNTPALVSLKDPSGKYTFVNDRFCQSLGKARNEIIGSTDEQLFSDEIANTLREKDFEALSKKTSVAYQHTLPNGHDKLVLYSAKVPLLDSTDSPRSVCTISLDISDKNRAEDMLKLQQEQIIRAGKLSALGEMAAGIAHEINTPLNAILANVDILERMVKRKQINEQELGETSSEIARLVQSITSIITGLRNIARAEKSPGFVKKSVSELIRETLAVCSFHVKNHGVKVDLEIPNEGVEIECQPVQLTQVLINLINNAVDAIQKYEEKWIKISASDAGDSVELSVTDCGKGIPAEVADKIMSPFFTTKEAGRGTGMGLSLSKSIVNIHRGKIFLDRSVTNTCFKVLLPKKQPRGERSEQQEGTTH